jgi:hypothetical protein
MSHVALQPVNVITVSRGGAAVVALTVTGMHQDHLSQLSVGNSETYWHGSTNAFQVTTPGVLAVPPNVTVTRGTSTALTQGPHPPRAVQASGRVYSAPQTTPQPNVDAASGRSSAFSRPPTTAPSALPRPRPRRPPTALSNPSYRGSSSDNQDQADSRGFHCAEGTNGRPQVGHARKIADPRVAPRTTPVDADRRGRYLVGPEYNAEGAQIARKYLDAAWGVTPSTKKYLGLVD